MTTTTDQSDTNQASLGEEDRIIDENSICIEEQSENEDVDKHLQEFIKRWGNKYKTVKDGRSPKRAIDNNERQDDDDNKVDNIKEFVGLWQGEKAPKKPIVENKRIYAIIAVAVLTICITYVILLFTISRNIKIAQILYDCGLISKKYYVSYIIDGLGNKQDEELVKIKNVIQQLGDDAVPMLETAIDEEDVIKREKAAILLLDVGAIGKVKETVLIKLIKNDFDSKVHAAAIEALVDNYSPRTITGLIALLKDENKIANTNAKAALAKIGPRAVPRLIKFIKEENPDLQSTIQSILHKMGKPVLPELISCLKDKKLKKREFVENAIVRFKQSAVPALVKAIATEKNENKNILKRTLKKIGPLAVKELIVAIKNKNINIRREAIDILGQFGKKAKSAIPELKKIANKKDSVLKEKATRAINAIIGKKNIKQIDNKKKSYTKVDDKTVIMEDFK